MNSLLLATLALAPQSDAPRFDAPAVDEDFLTRLAPPGDRWLATAPDGTVNHCGALYIDGIAVDLYASPAEGAPLQEYADQTVASAIEWYEDDSVASMEEVEFEGLRAFDVVVPSLSPDEAFSFMMLDAEDREDLELPYGATRIVDRGGIRYEFMTDATDDRTTALAVLRDACAGWSFSDGDAAPRSIDGEVIAVGPAWSLTGRTLDDALSGSRFELPGEDWGLGAEPPWEDSTGAVLASLAPSLFDESVPAGSVYVRRGLPPGVLAGEELAWAERADMELDADLAEALREAFPDAPVVAAFVSEGEELFGDSLPTIWVARVVLDAGDGVWTFVDAEVIDDSGVDPAEWAIAWIEAIVDGREALPADRRAALLESARTHGLDVANRRWSGRTLLDREVGVTWTAPDGIWVPEDPVIWAVPDEERRFDATCIDAAVRVEIDVARDISRAFERAAQRGVQRTLGGFVDVDALPDPILLDGPEGIEMARFELGGGFGDGRAGVVVVARVERQVYSIAASCRASSFEDRVDFLREVCAALEIDPAVAERSVWVDDDAFVDLEIGYAFEAPGEGWSIQDDSTFLDDKIGFSACAWRDDVADAWLGISANDVHGFGVEGETYDALTLSSAMGDFDDGFERSTVEVAGLTADVVSGTRGEGKPVTVVTFRRGTMAFSMTLSGRTEQFDALGALRRFRFVD